MKSHAPSSWQRCEVLLGPVGAATASCARGNLASTETDKAVISALHVSQSFGQDSFGVGVAALGLGDAQRTLGYHVENWSANSAQELAQVHRGEASFDPEYRCSRFGGVCGFERFRLGRWTFSPRLHEAIEGPLGGCFRVLHQHSIWSACSLATRRWRRKYRRPTVVSPQGTLDPWALRKSRLKKWIAGRLFERENLFEASCIQAVSASEVAACREFGLRNPVALIPNGVSRSWLESSGDANRFRDQLHIPSSKRILLFLSRVTPKKGLTMLFEAIADIGRQFDDWLLVVGGPDEYGHSRELAELADKLAISRSVRLIGPLYGESRRDAFEAAELFVLPTYGEGHPLALLEALGAGLPALTTTGAYCEFIPACGCGWQTEISADAVREGLLTALSHSGSELSKMGRRGKDYVREHLTWDALARLSVELYKWLCGLGPRPDFVCVG